MTTIAYRDGVLAADSQATCDYHGRVRKIHRLPSGMLVGGCGDAAECHSVVEWLMGGQEGKAPKAPDAYLIIVDKDGGVFFSSGSPFQPFPSELDFAAIGSGSAVAMGAMEAGASALEAVKIAAKHDGYTSGPFHTLKVNK